MSDVTLTFPDGASRTVKSGTTGLEVAKSISPSLAKRTVAMSLDGKLADLADPIAADANDQIRRPHRPGSARADPARRRARDGGGRAVAVAGTQVTIGPVIENGFYYDFAKQDPFHPDDLAKIEKQDARDHRARTRRSRRNSGAARRPRTSSGSKGEKFKVELVDAIPEGEDLKIYKQGEWLDLCRGPHMTSTGQVGKAFKLHQVRGRLLARRPQQAAAAAHLRHGLGDGSGARGLPARSSRKPRSATTASSAARWTSSISRRRRRARCSGTRRAGRCSRRSIAYMRRRLRTRPATREVNSPDMMEKHFWELSGHWENFRENMFVTELPDERVFCCKPMNCPATCRSSSTA